MRDEREMAPPWQETAEIARASRSLDPVSRALCGTPTVLQTDTGGLVEETEALRDPS